MPNHAKPRPKRRISDRSKRRGIVAAASLGTLAIMGYTANADDD